MNSSKPEHDAWDPCHPGILHEASQDDSFGRRRFIRFAGVLVVLAIVGGYVALEATSTERTPMRSRSFFPGGVSCLAVIEHLPALFSGEIDDEGLRKRLRIHLMKCEACRGQYDTMRCCEKQCKSRPINVTLKPCSLEAPSPSPSPSP